MAGTSSKGFMDTSRRSYVSAAAFNNDFYSYTVKTLNDETTVGILSLLPGATAINCPSGRVLRETGRKLYPNEANPGITTPMVAVYDPVTFLNGYIDPNSPAFAVYSTDTSYFFNRGVNPATGLPDVGPPVYTLGPISNTSGPIAGIFTQAQLYLPGYNQIFYNNTTANADLFIYPAVANMFEIDLTSTYV